MAPAPTWRSVGSRSGAGSDRHRGIDAPRRSVLGGAGLLAAVATAGCLGSLRTDGKRYAGHDRADLLIGLDAFPDGWEERPDLNEEYRVFGDAAGDVFVGLDAAVLPAAAAAETAFEEAEAGMADPESYALADEAFRAAVDDEYAITVFRHSNAVGQAFGLRRSGESVLPDGDRSLRYAEAMFTHWMGL